MSEYFRKPIVKTLMLKGEKGDISYPTDGQVQDAVGAWLTEHPEATTTVEDGSITQEKLSPDIHFGVQDGDVTTPKIADGAVTPDKTTFLTGDSNRNLFEGRLIEGGWIIGYDDRLKVLDIRSSKNDAYIEPIEVNENERYFLNPSGSTSVSIRDLVFLDQYRTLIYYKKMSIGEHEIVTPPGCKYMATDILLAYKDVDYLIKDGGNKYVGTDIITDGAKILDHSIPANKLDFVEKKSVNIMDGMNMDNIEYGYFTNTGAIKSGSFLPCGTDYVTDYLPVTPNTTYMRNKHTYNVGSIQYVPCYDEDKNLITVLTLPANTVSFMTPENCYYIRITCFTKSIPYDFIVPLSEFIEDDSVYTDPTVNLILGVSYETKKLMNKDGSISDGDAVTDNVSDYIPVIPGGKYYRSVDNTVHTYARYIGMYDQDKNLVGVINHEKPYSVNGYTLDGSFTVADNCYYIRMFLGIERPATDYLVTEENYFNGILETKTRYDRYVMRGISGVNEDNGSAPTVAKGLPRLDLYGDPSKMTASKNEVPFRYKYTGEEDEEIRYGYAKVKWQGNSSLSYPKKNYTIKFYNDSKFKSKDKHDAGFGYISSKYVTKANWVDHSHARNIVSARLWSRIVKSRSKVPAGLLASPNYGAVDGYPIVIYINDEYNGLYTLNIPKDDVTYGLDENNPLHCAVSGMKNNDGNMSLKTGADFRLDNLANVSGLRGWENEVPEVWNNDTKQGLFNLIKFVNESSDEEFRANLDKYLDVASVIDYYLFVYLICAIDSLGKNIILVTYDAVKWYMCAYDLDSTFGLFWNGGEFQGADLKCPEQYLETNSLLFQRVEKCFSRELNERYDELRSGILSVENITREFTRFMSTVGMADYNKDVAKWPNTPSSTTDHLGQIKSFIADRSVYVDGEISAMLVPCTNLTIGSASATVSVDGTVNLTATKNSGTTDMIDWSTADKTIATVDYNGVVTGVAPGTVVITAKCGEKTATCEITVS